MCLCLHVQRTSLSYDKLSIVNYLYLLTSECAQIDYWAAAVQKSLLVAKVSAYTMEKPRTKNQNNQNCISCAAVVVVQKCLGVCCLTTYLCGLPPHQTPRTRSGSNAFRPSLTAPFAWFRNSIALKHLPPHITLHQRVSKGTNYDALGVLPSLSAAAARPPTNTYALPPECAQT